MSNAHLLAPVPKRVCEFQSEFARALFEGLSASPKNVPCKYFYDAEGSALFDRICELPEYYPTRTELGLLLAALAHPRPYVPIDISGDYLRPMAARLKRSRPNLPVMPVVADFTKP